MKKPNVILCIDASTTNFGLAWFEDDQLMEVRNIVIKGVLDIDKLKKIWDIFQTELDDTTKVSKVVFEKPVPVQFSSALTSINQVIGLLIGLFYSRNIAVNWIHNKTIKSRMGIKAHGKEGKLESIRIAKTLYPFLADEITTDHIADAVLVGETYKILNK
jgi:aconitase A